MTFISIILALIGLVANWFIFKKMGREGWEGIIPFYNSYVLFEMLYGNGWKFLLLLIPVYNIYILFKTYIDLAHGFHKSSGFGVGMVLLSFIFSCILAFSNDVVWQDGSMANNKDDFVTNVASSIKKSGENRTDSQAFDKLKDLKELYDAGVLTQEEYEAKKEELLKRI